jgi:tRNA nucleotidyltransferase (CCA-adding enzyme)
MKVAEVIVAHTNTDFDALAAMLAAAKLYPRARICLTGALNRNVREFCGLYADQLPITDAGLIEPAAVRRLIAIETLEPNRLGELGRLLERDDVEVISFDHHGAAEPNLPGGRAVQRVTSEDGALTTLMLRILAERSLPVTPLEATVFALGIHEDTGSLTFTSSTSRDAEALAYCMRQGASGALIERFLHSPLSDTQRDLLARALVAAEPVDAGGVTVMVAALVAPEYVEEVAVVAHRYLEVTGCDAFVLLVGMEQRVFVIARSRSGALDVAAALEPVGGGGHGAAASAVLRDTDLATAREAVVAGVRAAGERSRTAHDVMSGPARWVDENGSVDEALRLCRRHGLPGVAVASGGHLVGSVSEADLRRAVGHELGHAPVKAVMTSGLAVVAEDAPLARVSALLAASPIGALPVVRAGAPLDRPELDVVVGVVRRGDLRELWGGSPPPAPPPAALNLSHRLQELGLDDLLEHIQAVGTGYAGVYLVGGAVRDLLLRERTLDIDIAVEGDGIAFAQELARRLGGHVRAHPKFRTAVVVAAEADGGEGLRVDVASTRSEFYQAPAALPVVEHATLRSDLARRDFSMNAMAVSLHSEDLGELHDYFGGMRDLADRRVVVLHNLSFIEDPTRIFRALRYEARYGLRMDAHTYNLALACSQMDLVGDLSSARLRDELVLLLREPRIDHAVLRMQELGMGRAVHPRLTTGATTRGLLRSAENLWRRYSLAGEAPLWRLRMVWLLRNLTPQEIIVWAQRMTFRRDDTAVLERAMVVGRRLSQRLAAGMSEPDLHEAAAGEPAEALLVAMILDEGGAVERRLAHYLAVTRWVHLVIGGRDLLTLGFEPGPRLGGVLRALLRMKASGLLPAREDELEAARRLL